MIDPSELADNLEYAQAALANYQAAYDCLRQLAPGDLVTAGVIQADIARAKANLAAVQQRNSDAQEALLDTEDN